MAGVGRYRGQREASGQVAWEEIARMELRSLCALRVALLCGSALSRTCRRRHSPCFASDVPCSPIADSSSISGISDWTSVAVLSDSDAQLTSISRSVPATTFGPDVVSAR